MATVDNVLSAALNEMNYTFLPNGAFDANHNVVLPSDFKPPASWDQTVGVVTQSPDWAALQKILGTLVTPGSDWSCWRVALSLHGGALRVIILRAVGSAGSQAGLNFANNLWSGVLQPLKEYAGRRRLLPQVATDAIKAVANATKDSSYWTNPKDNDQQQKERAYSKWQVTGALSILVSFVDLIASITVRSKVLVTMLWYDPDHPAVPTAQVEWLPIHQTYNGYNLRAIHYWWNSGWDSVSPNAYPFVYGAGVQLRGPAVTDVPHEPWELARMFYPLGNWPAGLDAEPGPPLAHRVCEPSDNGRMRCWTELAESLTGPSNESPHAGANAPLTLIIDGTVLTEMEALVRGTDAPPTGQPVVPGARDALTVTASPAAVLAHSLPWLGGSLLGGGILRGGIWYPDEASEPSIPGTVWLPSLQATAVFEAGRAGWVPASPIPHIVVADSHTPGDPTSV